MAHDIAHGVPNVDHARPFAHAPPVRRRRGARAKADVHMEMMLAVLGVVGPVFLVAAAGYAFAVRHPEPLRSMTDALFHVFVPALVFSSMSRTELAPSAIGEVALAAVLISLATGALARAWLALRGERSPAFLLVSMFGNNANMGMSVCTLAFGSAGLALAAAYYAAGALLTFTLGVHIAAGAGGHRELLRIPLLYAALAGLAVKLLGAPVPQAVDRAVELLGAAAIPSMLFALGHRLRSTRIRGLGMALAAVVLKMGVGLLVGLVVVELVGATGTTRAVLLLQASMPAAVINFVIAERYRQDAELVSSAIALGTFASVGTLPLLLAWLMG